LPLNHRLFAGITATGRTMICIITICPLHSFCSEVLIQVRDRGAILPTILRSLIKVPSNLSAAAGRGSGVVAEGVPMRPSVRVHRRRRPGLWPIQVATEALVTEIPEERKRSLPKYRKRKRSRLQSPMVTCINLGTRSDEEAAPGAGGERELHPLCTPEKSSHIQSPRERG